MADGRPWEYGFATVFTFKHAIADDYIIESITGI